MMLNPTTRQHALDAAKELIQSLNLSADEQHIVLGIALDKYESIAATVRSLALNENCISAIFAAALEYSESFSGEECDDAEP